MPLPICFVHTGDSWYLWYTLRQARLTNPTAPIYLIGDRHLPQYDGFATYVPIAAYMAEANAFAGIYRHLSTNSHAYELFCFQRWFVLKAFAAERLRGPFVTLDSDVMVYADLGLEQARFADYDLTVTKGKNPQNMFVAGHVALERFCSFVCALYAEGAAELERRYQAYRDEHSEGGICDMTAFDDYRQAFPTRVADAATIHAGSCFDNNVRRADGFAMARGYKRLSWSDGQPYGQHLAPNATVRFSTLHFQGGAKLLIPYFAHRRNLGFFRRLLLQSSPRRTARGLLLLAGR